jgi:hypothetical protein
MNAVTKSSLIALSIAALTAPLAAQQRVPRGNNGTPVAPQGLSVPAPPSAPVRFATAEGQDIVVETWVTGF